MYGLIGKTLKHSFSKEIHENLFSDEYKLLELEEKRIPDFLKQRKFKAINVTVPYKETVIPYLDELDETSQAIHAVNTIVNKNNKLYGYNTDCLGFKELLDVNEIDIKDKIVLILGSGGTSKTVQYVVNKLQPSKVFVVSRTKKDGSITYDEAKKKRKAQVIINTTPVGMYPNINNQIIDLKNYPKLESVVDVIYNPLQTKLLRDARERGLKYASGLYMLVAQAVYASEIFHDVMISHRAIKDLYLKLRKSKQNIVLIGMPTSGKTVIGYELANLINREFLDTDKLAEDELKCSIAKFFDKKSQRSFRKLESAIVENVSCLQEKVIATGGGVVLSETNIYKLRANSVIVFIDRPLEMLNPSEDRPLAKTMDEMKKIYNSRYELYKKYADVVVTNDSDNINKAVMDIKEAFDNYEKDSCY